MNWNLMFQAVMQTEENILPVFVHSPKAQKIVGVIMMAESIFFSVFSPAPAKPPTA